MFTLHVNASLPEFRHPSSVTRVSLREHEALFATLKRAESGVRKATFSTSSELLISLNFVLGHLVGTITTFW